MAVGSMGMLSTSNYLARKFGVRAAMPGFIGKKLCPQLTIVPPNFEKYTAVSKVVREVFSEYDPEFCPVSLDEAYLVNAFNFSLK
jgi:DNA polymerase kappa